MTLLLCMYCTFMSLIVYYMLRVQRIIIYVRVLSVHFCTQLQYVLTHKAIEPREFCQTLHICNQTQANSAHRRKSPLLQAIERMVREVKLTEERRLLKMVEAERHKPAQGVFKTSGAAQLSKFVGVASLPMESAEKTATSSKSKMFYPPQSRQSSAGPRVAQSDTLRILQISDIHLDTDYSEVRLTAG